jgi:hypothetical protein
MHMRWSSKDITVSFVIRFDQDITHSESMP